MNSKALQHYEEMEKRFFEDMDVKYPYRRPKSEWIKSDPEKILSIADLHEPYSNQKVLKDALKHKDAHTLIIPGDIGDYYSKSRFRKTRHVSFKTELRSVLFRMEWLATHWKDVKILMGNHDNRPEKTLLSLIDGQTDLVMLTEQNLLKRMAKYFDNIDVVSTKIDGTDDLELTHVYQFGDIVFTHGELSRAQDSAVLQVLSNHLFKWRDMYKLKPYRFIAQAHNHAAMKMWKGTEAWFLLPTASDPYTVGFEYIYQPKPQGNPPALGYTVFRQSRGETDFNGSYNYLVK